LNGSIGPTWVAEAARVISGFGDSLSVGSVVSDALGDSVSPEPSVTWGSSRSSVGTGSGR